MACKVEASHRSLPGGNYGTIFCGFSLFALPGTFDAQYQFPIMLFCVLLNISTLLGAMAGHNW